MYINSIGKVENSIASILNVSHAEKYINKTILNAMIEVATSS